MKIIDVHQLWGIDIWLSKNKPNLFYKNDENIFFTEVSSNKLLKTFLTPFPSSHDNSFYYENIIIKELTNENDLFYPVYGLNTNSKDSYKFFDTISNENKFGVMITPILCRIDFLELSKDNRFIDFCLEYEPCITIDTPAGNEVLIGRVNDFKNCQPEDALELSLKLDNVNFNMAHLFRLSENALRESKNLKNVMLDTSGVSSNKVWIENGYNVFPSPNSILDNLTPEEILKTLIDEYELEDKIMFGSIFPFCKWWGNSFNDEINLINNLDTSSETKEKIFHKNALEFYNMHI